MPNAEVKRQAFIHSACPGSLIVTWADEVHGWDGRSLYVWWFSDVDDNIRHLFFTTKFAQSFMEDHGILELEP